MINASTRWLMFATDDAEVAERSYRHKTGMDATVCLARPELSVKNETPSLVRSKHGPADAILVTHELSPKDCMEEDINTQVRPDAHKATARHRAIDPNVVPDRKPGRPFRGGSKCPHCGGKIADFNDLGYWYGWSIGKTPPYWDELRLYVFHRDNYRCQKCRSQLPAAKLNAHHIEPKETGGTDSARNLLTLCLDCHEDLYPIIGDN